MTRAVTALYAWVLLACLTPTAVVADDATASDVPDEPTAEHLWEVVPPPPPLAVYEIEVVSEAEIKRRRNELERSVEDIGYKSSGWRKGYEVFQHPIPWRPEVWIDASGLMRLKRRRVHFRLPTLGPGIWDTLPMRALACVLSPTLCVRVGGQTISPRKLAPHKKEVVEDTHLELVAWQDALATKATGELLDRLPTEMERLWGEGVHPETGEMVTSMEARRAILLQIWVHKADNRWGLAVRRVVGDFIRFVVQDSPFPVTARELEQINALRKHGPPLVL